MTGLGLGNKDSYKLGETTAETEDGIIQTPLEDTMSDLSLVCRLASDLSLDDIDVLQLPLLPENAIREILIKVPAKSLIRFKSVSKRWLKLVSQPKFSHGHLSSYVLKNTQPEIIITQAMQLSRHFCISSVDEYNQVNNFQFHLKEDRLPRVPNISIQTTCNGLIIIIVYEEDPKLYVHNPLTQQSMHLSFPPPHFDKYLFSLVYDVSAENYKVVALDPYEYRCFVVTLQSPHIASVWRELTSPSPGVALEPQPIIHLNNELHWLMENREKMQYIQTMNVAKEEFGRIDCPLSGGLLRCYRLFEMKGSLHMVDTLVRGKLDIWILDDRDKGLWSKAHCIRADVSFYHVQELFSPIGSETELFFRFGNRCVLYDTKNRTFRIVFETRGFLSAFTHINSLVSW